MAEMGKGVTAGKLAINVQKRLTRAQEKVLQKLGKADETRDAAFEEMVANFNKQMVEGSKLQKDLKTYVTAVKTLHDASRRLQDCLADMYEPDWFGKEEMDALAEDTDTLWLDYHQSITDKSVTSMDTYLTQFPDIKARIAKRDRKMVDFDSARHHFASLQKGKKKDEAKIAKQAALLEMAAPSWAQGLISAHQVAQTNLSFNQAEEDLGRAQKIFEELNVELQDELPALWDSRVGVYVNTFQGLAGHQEKFHKDMSKLSQNLNDIMTKLEEQRQLKKDGTAAAKTEDGAKSEEADISESASSAPKAVQRPGPPPSRPPPRPSLSPDPAQHQVSLFDDEASVPDSNADSATTTTTTQQCEPWSGVSLLDWDVEVLQPVTSPASKTPSWDSWQEQPTAEKEQPAAEQEQPTAKQEQPPAKQEPQPDGDQFPAEAHGGWDHNEAAAQSCTQPSWVDAEAAQGSWNADQGSAAQPYTEPNWDDAGANVGQGGWGDAGEQSAVTNGSDGELPPGFIYKVKAIHDYDATDGDELELKMGDIVLVMGFDNPDEQDDGWLMGVKESKWLQEKDATAKGVFPENFTQKF
ncbi:myc box-dependent-interacting protein 1b isoform X3 [Hippoglossus stenolepis]|uniref:myc box-dependent-interacting protein 1b isoform X3 n=1 Tax=Hippoglossus stenolepis TaxID=195615 RepID=UPI001FAEE9E1|nr:myc box-dependent-interacting protein 1b isoform X3 [Hippoglossus stenolepis]